MSFGNSDYPVAAQNRSRILYYLFQYRAVSCYIPLYVTNTVNALNGLSAINRPAG
jgi:hypothetical protein